ncbi:GNAT family N-acetyltransferase [Desulfosporosinus sp. SB140]|uniref:GNAT family N-acetyltransferase n=1 Tax=Desulfosporosinus paludis TaxID=3115649 RepID=UPI003890E707
MDIQLAEKKHEQAIFECVCTAYSVYIQRMCKKPAPMLSDYSKLIEENVVYIATDSEEFMGIIVFFPKGNSLFIENVAVHPGFQGRGTGRKLIEFAFNFAKKAGLQEVNLYTNELMTENIKYYHRLGFVEAGRRLEDGYRRVYFVKPL